MGRSADPDGRHPVRPDCLSDLGDPPGSTQRIRTAHGRLRHPSGLQPFHPRSGCPIPRLSGGRGGGDLHALHGGLGIRWVSGSLCLQLRPRRPLRRWHLRTHLLSPDHFHDARVQCARGELEPVSGWTRHFRGCDRPRSPILDPVPRRRMPGLPDPGCQRRWLGGMPGRPHLLDLAHRERHPRPRGESTVQQCPHRRNLPAPGFPSRMSGTPGLQLRCGSRWPRILRLLLFRMHGPRRVQLRHGRLPRRRHLPPSHGMHPPGRLQLRPLRPVR